MERRSGGRAAHQLVIRQPDTRHGIGPSDAPAARNAEGDIEIGRTAAERSRFALAGRRTRGAGYGSRRHPLAESKSHPIAARPAPDPDVHDLAAESGPGAFEALPCRCDRSPECSGPGPMGRWGRRLDRRWHGSPDSSRRTSHRRRPSVRRRQLGPDAVSRTCSPLGAARALDDDDPGGHLDHRMRAMSSTSDSTSVVVRSSTSNARARARRRSCWRPATSPAGRTGPQSCPAWSPRRGPVRMDRGGNRRQRCGDRVSAARRSAR